MVLCCIRFETHNPPKVPWSNKPCGWNQTYYPQFIPLHYSRSKWDFLQILSSRKLKWLLLPATWVTWMWKSAWNILPPQIVSSYYTNLIIPTIQQLNTFEFTTMISAVLVHHTSHIKILKNLYIQFIGFSTWHGTFQVTVMVPDRSVLSFFTTDPQMIRCAWLSSRWALLPRGSLGFVEASA